MFFLLLFFVMYYSARNDRARRRAVRVSRLRGAGKCIYIHDCIIYICAELHPNRASVPVQPSQGFRHAAVDLRITTGMGLL